MSDHRHRRRWLRRTLWILALLGVLLVIDAAWLGLTTRGNLETARTRIRDGADAMLKGDVVQASSDFAAAKAAADRAGQLSLHPAGIVGGFLPWIGDDVHAVDDLAKTASLSAEAGQTLADAAARVGWNGNTVPGVSGHSGISSGVLAQIAPEVRTAHDQLAEAQSVLDGVRTDGLLSPVADAVETARGELTGRVALLGSAADVADLVPMVMEKGHRYELIIQNPGEVRGTGGFMGFFGTLESDGTRLQLTQLAPVGSVPKVHPVRASAEFKARYARFESLIDIRQANFSPDLPTTAGVVTQIGKELGWGAVDGIVLVDPVWMQYMLEATGPITAPGWDGPISSDNVIDILGRQLPALPEDRSNVIQRNIGEAVWTAIQTHDLSPSTFGTALSRSVQERHMQLWFADPAEEALADHLGASGRTILGANPIAVVWQGLAASKVAIDTERSVDVNVALGTDGTATVTETLHVTNHAPSGPPSDLLGDAGGDFPVGAFAGYASVYLPATIEGRPFFTASAPTVTGVEHEFGHDVALGFLEVPAGGQMTWSVTYLVPNAVTQIDADTKEYRLDFLPQPAFEPGPVNVTVRVPDGATIADRSPGAGGGGQTATYRDRPTVPTAIWIRY